MFGFNLIYSEKGHKLTVPVEFGLDRSCNIGTAVIRHWDGSADVLARDQIIAIEKNIFDGLDYLGIRYTNVR